ncbi:uncharacterized protein [Spinacia oleracea]|uniref:Reverse transcriptase domain-containing protein n=1 Tax=Spinacia oleracea TaxID=3562 RepID=A0ABM3QYF1_SPIOL|nr:uncharacterized protein LOC130463332 [Spinacia oleracea]
MRILSWNIQGGKKLQAIGDISHYINSFKPDILFVLETMTSNFTSRNVIKGFRFQKHIIIDPINHSGGLWVCWNNDSILVQNYTLVDRCAHLNVLYKPTNEQILVSGAYFPAQNNDKDQFWELISSFYDNIHIPWILVGDFNELLHPLDKCGGNPVTQRQCQRLPRFLTRSNATDIACIQQSYSWKSQSHPGLYQRLDRAVASNNFTDKFPNASVKYGTFTSSDHAPMFFDTNSETIMVNRLFRFQNSWTLEDEPAKIVKEHWNFNTQGSRFFRIRSKLTNIKGDLKNWAKGKFSHKTMQLKTNADKIQELEDKLITQPFNPIWQNHLLRMLKQRERILLQKQHLWKNSAKKTWLNQGDRNTRFFHQLMKHRAAKNHIYRLKNADNHWEEGQVNVQNILFNSFQDRFKTSVQPGRIINLDFLPQLISDSDRLSLIAPFSDEEIKNSFFTMKPLKAPGSDGFGPKFFQTYWKTIGPEVTLATKSFFSHGKIPPFLNHTLIALIPKNDNPENPNHFRPISLCGTIYKAISKLLVSRLSPILQKHISPFQNAFTPGRSIHDNLLLVQEILNVFKKSKSKVGWCALKLDMEKAYDRIEWDILWVTLDKMGFPTTWINWVKATVTTVSYSIKVNNSTTDIFTPSRGQLVNFHKSAIIFSKNINHPKRDALASIFNMNKSGSLGRYLGAHFSNFTPTRSDYLRIMQKNERCINSWQANFLSKAGKTTLIQSNLEALPSYICSSFLLPRKTCHQLDNVHRQFFWNQSKSGNALPLIAWNKVCQPKDQGGLGLRRTYPLNRAFIAKLGWKILTDENNLWAKIMRKKYLQNTNFFSAKRKIKDSPIWISILNQREILRKGIRWKIGNGNHINFWKDNWVGQYALSDLPCNSPNSSRGDVYVNSFIDESKNWDIRKLSSFLTPELVQKIKGIPIPVNEVPDNPIWGCTNSGEFSVKSATWLAHELPVSDKKWEFRWIWKLNIAPKLKIFLWQICHKSIPTKETLFHRKIIPSSCCPRCNHASENINHLFLNCEHTKNVWMHRLTKNWFDFSFPMTDFFKTLDYLRRNQVALRKFITVCWTIWKERNALVFSNNKLSPCRCFFKALNTFKEWELRLQIDSQQLRGNHFNTHHPSTSLPTTPQPILVRWFPPPLGAFKLNFDGSRKDSSATGGIIIRNNNGDTVITKSFNLVGEYERGDELSWWYPDDDKTIRSKYSPTTCAYTFVEDICHRYPRVTEVNLCGNLEKNLEALTLGRGQLGKIFFLALSDYPLLKKLVVSDVTLGNVVQEISINHERLEHLQVTKCRVLCVYVPQLRILSLKRSNMAHVVLNCPTLNNLDSGSCHKLSDAAIRSAVTSCSCWRLLTCLDVHVLVTKCFVKYLKLVRIFYVKMSLLTVLKLERCEAA